MQSPEELNSLGLAAFARKEWRAAGLYFLDALRMRGNYTDAACNLAFVSLRLGKYDEAVQLAQYAVSLDPAHRGAHIAAAIAFMNLGKADDGKQHAITANEIAGIPGLAHGCELGKTLARCGLRAEAVARLNECLAADPSDKYGAAMALAQLGEVPLPERTPDAMIQRIYAAAAGSWEKRESYFAPKLVAEKVIGSNLDILDAGCGTGIVGSLIRDKAKSLIGVDLSENMAEQTRAKAIYDQVLVADMNQVMHDRPKRFDVVICIATLIHFGPLVKPFDAAFTALRTGGAFIFTVFANGNDEQYHSGGVASFVHGKNYITRTAEACGFAVDGIDRAIHEHSSEGTPVSCYIVNLRKGWGLA